MAMKRSDRVGDEMKRLLARAIQTEVQDPRIPALTSVTEVKVSGDIGHASVGISVYGTPDEQRAAVDALSKAAGFLRTYLSKEMRIRQVPELHFELDDSAAQGARIDRLLDEALGRQTPTSVPENTDE